MQQVPDPEWVIFRIRLKTMGVMLLLILIGVGEKILKISGTGTDQVEMKHETKHAKGLTNH